MFNDIIIDDKIEGEKDVLGGGRQLFPSDVYDFRITMAYGSVSNSGAKALNLVLEDSTGKELRVTEYVTSGKAKGGKATYVNAKGETQYLPGFQKMNALCLLATGKNLPEVDAEEKVISLYNYEAKKELPTKAMVMVGLLGAKVKAAVIHKIENKNEKNAEGVYEAVAETREFNEVDRFFNEDGFTSSEIAAKAEKPEFIDTWINKFKDQIVDKSKKDLPASKGTQGSPLASAAAKPAKSMFGD